MIETKVLLENRLNRIYERMRKRGIPQSLSRSAFLLRKVAQSQFRRTKKRPSPAGLSPHTRKGRLPRAILYQVDRQREEAVIGPSHVLAGEVGGVHEHGGQYKKQKFPPRPFMGPALDKSVPLIGPQWSGAIGG